MDDVGSETIKTTVEKMAQAGNQAFKDSVEKSLGALNEVNALSKGNIEAVVESLTAATKGAETVGKDTTKGVEKIGSVFKSDKTFACSDGTSQSGKTGKAACADHGGVKAASTGK